MGNKQSIEKTHQAHSGPQSARATGPSTMQQLAFTAAGAAGSAILGAILTRQGYAPKTVSGTIAALGAGLASVGDSDALRALGTGAMSASGAQLVLMMFAEHEDKNDADAPATAGRASPVDRPPAVDASNANVVPLAAKAAAS